MYLRQTLTLASIVLGTLALALFFVDRVSRVREAAVRTHRAGNCTSIAHALERYGRARGHLPPPVVFGPNKEPYHSWRALILEYMDTDLFKRYDFSLPWHHEKNKQVRDARNGFSARQPSGNKTEFVCVLGPGSLFEEGSLDKMPAGVHFLLLEHKDSDIDWTEPRDICLDDIKAEALTGGQLVYLIRAEAFRGSYLRLKSNVNHRLVQQAFRCAPNELNVSAFGELPFQQDRD